VLLFLLAVAVAWAFGAGLAVTILWRHRSEPAGAVFVGAWLLLWVGAPVSVVRGLRSAERAGPERMWQGSDRGAACIFFGCFTAAWFAALVGVLKQGDVGGFLAMCAFTAVFFTGFIAEFLRIVQRQTVWTDPLELAIRNTYGPLRRTRRYELRLILNPRAERKDIERFVKDRLRHPGLEPFTLKLYDGVVAHQVEIDRRLSEAASNWRLPRMAVVDRNVLRIGSYELLFTAETPHSVAIDEAIELARRYGSANSPAFVNGVLDHLRQVAAPIA